MSTQPTRRLSLRRLCLVVSATLVLFACSLARADTCPAPEGSPRLAAVDTDTRLTFLLQAMDQEAAHLRTWSIIWGTSYAVITVAQLTALPFVEEPTRDVLIVGTVAAAVGSATLYLLPLRITSQAPLAHEEALDHDRCRALANVEARFFKTANIDRLSASWIAHAGNVAINGAVVLILGFGLGQWPAAAIAGGIGITVGEVNLFTQPHELIGAERAYRLGLETIGGARPLVPRLGQLVGPRLAGVQMSLAW